METLVIEDKVKLLFINPLSFWIFWAICYRIFYCIFDKPKYSNGVKDFKNMAFLPKSSYGDLEYFTIEKYLLQHLFFYLINFPIAWLSLYYFYFNSFYILFIMIMLLWNATKNNEEFVKKKLENDIDDINELKNEKTD